MTFPPEAKALNCLVMPKDARDRSISHSDRCNWLWIPDLFCYLLAGEEISLPELKLWEVLPSARPDLGSPTTGAAETGPAGEAARTRGNKKLLVIGGNPAN